MNKELKKKRKLSKKSKIKKNKNGYPAVFKVFLITGIIFLLLPSLFYLNETLELSLFTPKVKQIVNVASTPIKLTIPSVDLSLPITETVIVNGIWQVSSDKVSHLFISARPGEEGVIILYSHNTNNLLGPIRWLNKNNLIIIQTSDKKVYHYRVIKTEDVSPNDLSLLTAQKGESLILYTCDGFADLQRFVVVAKPEKD